MNSSSIGVGAYSGGSGVAIGATIRPGTGATVVIGEAATTVVIGEATASLVTSEAAASIALLALAASYREYFELGTCLVKYVRT